MALTGGTLTLFREISLRRAKSAPVRSVLVVVGVALGVCLWVAMLSTNDSLVQAFEHMVGRLAGRADLVVSGAESGIPVELVSSIAEVDGVAHAAPVLEEIAAPADGSAPVLLLGIDLLGDGHFASLAPPGADAQSFDALAFVNDPDALLISTTLARERKLSVGSRLALATAHGTHSFVVRGVFEPNGALTAFGGQLAVMFLDALQLHYARGTLVDRIDVAVEPGTPVTRVEQALRARLRGVTRVERARGRARELEQTLATFRRGLLLSGAIALLVSLFLVYNAVAIGVAQRRKEIGVLRALGVTRGAVVRMFALEAAVAGTLGGVLGVWAAPPLARLVLEQSLAAADRFMLPLAPELGPRSFAQWALGIASGVCVSLVAAVLPARAAGRVEPASCVASGRTGAALAPVPHARLLAVACVALVIALSFARRRELDAGMTMLLAMALAVVCLTPSAVVALARLGRSVLAPRVGVSVSLALGYIERGLAASSVTVIALMLGIGTSVSVSTWLASLEGGILAWVDDAFPADLMITSGSALLDQHHLPLAESTLERIARVQGVAHAYGVRSPDQIVRGQRVQLMSLDTRAYLEAQARRARARPIVDGPSQLASDALYAAPRVLVSENLAARLGLHAGDSLSYDTPSGARRFSVLAIVRDFSSPEGWVLCDRRYYREAWRDPSLDQVDVLLAPGESPRVVASRIRAALGGAASLFVLDHASFKAEVKRATHGTFAYARAPEWITLIVALLGVLATMLAAAIDRSRDMALLRAVGATRTQVSRVIVLEGALLALIAALVGVLGAMPQAFVLVRVLGYALAGWELPYTFAWSSALRVSAWVIAGAALASWWPARRLACSEPGAVPQE